MHGLKMNWLHTTVILGITAMGVDNHLDTLLHTSTRMHVVTCDMVFKQKNTTVMHVVFFFDVLAELPPCVYTRFIKPSISLLLMAA